MAPLIVSFVLFLVAPMIAAGVVFLIILLVRFGKRYDAFLSEHSVALKKLAEINGRYVFPQSLFKEDNSYDNEIFYNSISCEDFLIYQLQYKKNFFLNEIKRNAEGKKKYNEYRGEIDEIDSFGKYDAPTKRLKPEKLLSLEMQIFKKGIIKPVEDFAIIITLILTNINGEYRNRKRQTFGSEQTRAIIRRLNDKSGEFYNDRWIWDALCRVERGKVTNKMRFAIYRRDGYRCRMCGRSNAFHDLEIDHVKPIAKGGKSTYDNLQTLCKRCNMEKGAKY